MDKKEERKRGMRKKKEVKNQIKICTILKKKKKSNFIKFYWRE
jgi:hypothetical protein